MELSLQPNMELDRALGTALAEELARDLARDLVLELEVGLLVAVVAMAGVVAADRAHRRVQRTRHQRHVRPQVKHARRTTYTRHMLHRAAPYCATLRHLTPRSTTYTRIDWPKAPHVKRLHVLGVRRRLWWRCR